ncbi:hypothetical protein ACWGGS_01665 [Streptomyces decoyicus]
MSLPGLPPKVTAVAPVRSVPITVTLAPPQIGLSSGHSELTVGEWQPYV